MSDNEEKPPAVGAGAAVGDFIEQSIRKLPASSWAGLAGIGAFYLAVRFIPESLPADLAYVLQVAFTIGAIICGIPIVRGVFRNS